MLTNLVDFREVDQKDFLALLEQLVKPRKKRLQNLPSGSHTKKIPYLLDKLAQLSPVMRINDLCNSGTQFCSTLFYPKIDLFPVPEKGLLERIYFFPSKPCKSLKITIKSKERINRAGMPCTYKKILPRPKLIFIRKYCHTVSIDLNHIEALKEREYQAQKKESKYTFLHLQNKLLSNKEQLKKDESVLLKKAKAKHFTFTIVNALTQIDSPLQEGYKRSLECSNTLNQNENKVTAKYCKNRWCIVCNRIRTAKLINGYTPILNTFDSPQLLTLTIPNMKVDQLPSAMNAMQFIWRKIYKHLKKPSSNKKYQAPIQGLKKLECTYNPLEDTYHPHYHFITENDLMAELIMQRWLSYWNSNCYLPKGYQCGKLSADAQNYKPIEDSGGFLELFKYFTKIISKSYNTKDYSIEGIYIEPLDKIFQSMYAKRTFEPIGIKAISEDIDELQTETYTHLAYESKLWEWAGEDWISNEQPLTGYKPCQSLKNILEKIIL
jgi:hypothetical protein